MSDADELSAIIDEATKTQKPSQAVLLKVRDFFSTRGRGSKVTISNCRGGTQQIRNRLGQKAVQEASDLAILFLKPMDNLDGVLAWLEGAFNGEHGNIRPRGPVAIAQQGKATSSHRIVGVVHTKPTLASRLVAQLFAIESVDARTQVTPRLPPMTDLLFLRESNDADEYLEFQGPRCTFKSLITNGSKLQAGVIVVTGTTDLPRPGITGLGRIGRRIDHGQKTFAYYDRFRAVDISFDEIDEPKTKDHLITRVQSNWVLAVMKAAGIIDIELLPVPIHELTVETVASRLAAAGLVFDPEITRSAVVALRAGKHVILTGPPGTGKTSLALVLAETAAERGLSGEPLLTTGTADWSSVETVGAYRLNRERELEFHPGHVLLAIKQRRWLVIDELNRADIDKAIGQIFTVLSGHPVTLPFTSSSVRPGDEDGSDPDDDGDVLEDRFISIVPAEAIVPEGTSPVLVPDTWRLIATMNDRDQDLLFSLSEALMRRFAVIAVAPPRRDQWEQIMTANGGTGNDRWDKALSEAVSSLAKAGRPLGAAVLLDCVTYLREVLTVAIEESVDVDETAAICSAWALYVRPQLALDAGQEIDPAKLLLAAVDAPAGGDAGPVDPEAAWPDAAVAASPDPEPESEPEPV